MTTIPAADIEAFLANNQKAVIVVSAEWCGPCKNYAPIVDGVASANPDYAFAKVNIDEAESAAFASQHSVRGVPATLIFINGKRVQKLMGSMVSGDLAAALS